MSAKCPLCSHNKFDVVEMDVYICRKCHTEWEAEEIDALKEEWVNLVWANSDCEETEEEDE